MTTDSIEDSSATLRGVSLSPSLTVNDLEKSLAWYRDVVALPSTRGMSAMES